MVKEITKEPISWAKELGLKLEFKEPQSPALQRLIKTEMSATAFCYQLFLSKEIFYEYKDGKGEFEKRLIDFQKKYFVSDRIVSRLLQSKKGTM